MLNIFHDHLCDLYKTDTIDIKLWSLDTNKQKNVGMRWPLGGIETICKKRMKAILDQFITDQRLSLVVAFHFN